MRAACIAAFSTSTASVVAARVGVSRAAVLGIVKRARDAGNTVALVRPVSARAQRRAARIAAAEVIPARPTLPPLGIRTPTVGTPMPIAGKDPAPLFVVDVDDLPALMTLGERQCRAIIEDDGACCGLPTEGRSSWCRAHRAAYRAVAPRSIRLREDML